MNRVEMTFAIAVILSSGCCREINERSTLTSSAATAPTPTAGADARTVGGAHHFPGRLRLSGGWPGYWGLEDRSTWGGSTMAYPAGSLPSHGCLLRERGLTP